MNAYNARKIPGFKWSVFAEIYLDVDASVSTQFGNLLEIEWKKLEPLMKDIGPQLDSDPLNLIAEDHNDCSEVEEAAEDQPELPQSSKNAELDREQENKDTAVRGADAHVPERFFDDPLMGMGLREAVVRSRYSHQEDEPEHKKVTLKQRIEMSVEKMESAKSTTEAYIRITNIFLVSNRSHLFLLTFLFPVVVE